MLKVSVSLAAAPQQHMAQVVAELEAARVDMLHIDIEDGSFVPAMNLGTKLIGDLRPLTALPFDVHLMMVNPEWLLPQLATSGANRIAVHAEACPYPRRVLRRIKELGLSAGLAFNPATPISDLSFLKPYLDYVILLTTEPEGPDAPFLPSVLAKLHRHLPGSEDVEWVVDGGVGVEQIQAVARAGASTVVVGRSAFAGGKLQSNLNALRQALG